MISIVIPVYNNSGTLVELAQRVRTCMQSNPYEILFVNDGSKDHSLVVLTKIAEEDSNVKVLSLSKNFGQHPAISAGFTHASGDVIVLMDADLQDAPEDIEKLTAPVLSGACEVAYSIRVAQDKSSGSRLTSKLYHYTFAKIVGEDIPPDIGTFRAFSRKVLHAINSYREYNALYGPLMLYMGYSRVFVEVGSHSRLVGTSSYTFLKRLRLASHSLLSYTSVPHTVSIVFGLAMLGLSFLMVLVVLAQYFIFGRQLPPGMTIVILLLMVMLGSIMTSLGILGTYVFRVYQETLGRPRFLIEEKINL